MRRHKTNPLDALDLVDPIDQTRKITVEIRLIAVGIYILSQQSDFFYTVRRQSPDLLYDGFRHSAALPAPGIRHDAVGAEIIAAVHDIHIGFIAVLPVHRKSFDDLLLTLVDRHQLFAGGETLLQKPGKFLNTHSTEHDIHPGVFLTDPLCDMFLLHHTAADCDDIFRMALLYFFDDA